MTSLSTSYPLGPPTISGSTVTLDVMLSQPTRITRYLSDLTLRNFFAAKIFNNGGTLSGGALIYDQVTTNDLFPDRDVQNVEPGAEFPLVTGPRTTPQVAQVEKFGGKFFITDEARDRNDPASLQIPGRQLANAITRKMDTRALAVLDASISTFSTTGAGTSWADAAALTNTNVAPNLLPTKDFSAVQLTADVAELGVRFDTIIVNPQEASNFQLIFGENWRNVLSNWGMTMVVTNRVAAGTAYVVESGMVGEMRLEQPLTTEVWRENATQRTWVQSSVRPVFAVTNPYAVYKLTGLAA